MNKVTVYTIEEWGGIIPRDKVTVQPIDLRNLVIDEADEDDCTKMYELDENKAKALFGLCELSYVHDEGRGFKYHYSCLKMSEIELTAKDYNKLAKKNASAEEYVKAAQYTKMLKTMKTHNVDIEDIFDSYEEVERDMAMDDRLTSSFREMLADSYDRVMYDCMEDYADSFGFEYFVDKFGPFSYDSKSDWADLMAWCHMAIESFAEENGMSEQEVCNLADKTKLFNYICECPH